MPLVPVQDDQKSARGALGREPPAPPSTAMADVVGAAFRQQNTVASLLSSLHYEGDFQPDPTHNPLDLIRDTPYFANYATRFLASQSEAETRSIMRRIDAEESDRRTLEAAGTGGVITQMLAGMLDPTIALPGGVAVDAGKLGLSFGRTAMRVGTAAAVQIGAQEAILQRTQETRSMTESLMNVASGTVLSALLGAGAVRLLAGPERRALTEALDGERTAMAAHATGQPPPAAAQPATISPADVPAPANDAGSALAASAGAAAADARKLELVGTGIVGKVTAKVSPTRRVLSSQSVAARRTMADLAETPYRFTENVEGVAATQGGALDRIAKTQILGVRVQVMDEMQRLFSEYRFGAEQPRFPLTSAKFADLTGKSEGYMGYGEFKAAVTDALRNGDRSAVPQVAAAAQTIRQKVLEPWKLRAQEAGLLPEEIATRTAESYAPRMWNKDAIAATRPAFVDKITGWLETDQAAKRAAQERITALADEIKAAETRLAAIEQRVGKQITEDGRLKLADEAANLVKLRDIARSKLEKELADWQGTSASEARSALKAREKYAAQAAREPGAERLTSADTVVDRVVARILKSDRNLSREDLRSRAQEITDRILSSPDGRLPYDIHNGGPEIGFHEGPAPRGSLAARDFAIPDELIKEYLENDAEHLVGQYLRTVVPDVLLTERFGDVRMTEAFRKINEQYAALADAAKSEKARRALDAERQGVIRDIAAVRDRIRSVYGWSPDLRNAARVANGAKAVSNLATGGSFAISSLPDLAGPVFRHGFLNTLRDGFMPFLSSLMGESAALQAAKQQWRAVGIGIETTLAARQHALDDVMATYRPGSQFERGLQYASDKFFVANLLNLWTDWAKTVSANVAAGEILRAVEAVAKGKGTARQIKDLAAAGIDAQMAGRIWRQFDPAGEIKAGQVIDNVYLPNTADWTDAAARQALESAVARDVDIAIITPGQEKPLWMSQPVISLLAQFKTFVAAANERLLIANLQQRDARTLSGLIFAMGLGTISYRLNALASGTPVSDKPQDWIKESISRAGILGWLEEGNALTAKMTNGTVDVYRIIGADRPLSRYASRSALDQLLGPTWGKLQSLRQITGAAASGDWNASDTHALRRLTAFQNLFYVRRLFDELEAGANNAFGIPPKSQ